MKAASWAACVLSALLCGSFIGFLVIYAWEVTNRSHHSMVGLGAVLYGVPGGGVIGAFIGFFTGRHLNDTQRFQISAVSLGSVGALGALLFGLARMNGWSW